MSGTFNEWIPLPELSAVIRDLTGHPGPGYRRLHLLAMDGAISPPVEKLRGRWGCYRSNLRALVVALGLPLRSGADSHQHAA